MMDPLIHIAIRAFLALIFAAALAHKMRDWRRFEGVIANFAVAPAVFSPWLAKIVIVLEASVITLLVIGPGVVAGSAAAAIFAGYGALIFANMRRGNRSMDCGCSWVKSATLSYDYVLRNAALTGVSLMLFVQTSGRSLIAIDYANAICFALMAAGAYFLLDGVFHMKSLEAAQ